MLDSSSVTNELAMTVSGKVVHYSPLFPGSRWWRKPLTSLSDHDAGKRKIRPVSSTIRRAVRWWIMMFNRLRLGNLPILDPLHLFPSSSVPVYTDASGVHGSENYLQRGAGVYLNNNSLVRITDRG